MIDLSLQHGRGRGYHSWMDGCRGIDRRPAWMSTCMHARWIDRDREMNGWPEGRCVPSTTPARSIELDGRRWCCGCGIIKPSERMDGMHAIARELGREEGDDEMMQNWKTPRTRCRTSLPASPTPCMQLHCSTCTSSTYTSYFAKSKLNHFIATEFVQLP